MLYRIKKEAKMTNIKILFGRKIKEYGKKEKPNTGTACGACEC